jgi:BON domain
MKRKALLASVAAAAAALALCAQAQEQDSTYHGGSRFHRDIAADNVIHAAALDPADQQLANRIADALSHDKSIHNAPVTVTVNHGDVTLVGPIDNRQTVSRIEEVARRVAGRGHVFPMV